MSGFALPFLASAAALRVASLDLCADEYLLLLARPAEVASVSRVGRDPMDSPLWRQARRYPANDGSVEGLLRDRPTLILTSGGGGGKSTRLLASKLGIRTLALPFPATIDDVAANMTRVAVALGDVHRADRWKARLARLRRKPPPLRDGVWLSGGGLSLPADSLGAEWLALGGYRQRALPGARLTLEQLAIDPPPTLIVSSYRAGQASRGQQWLDHPLVRNSRAHRVTVGGRPWTCAGPLMLDAVEQLRTAR